MRVKIIILIVILFALSACSNTKSYPANENVIAFLSSLSISFSEKGFLDHAGGPLRFTSSTDGTTAILCDKPDCFHAPVSMSNPNPSCLAQVPSLANAMLHGQQQILICGMEDSPIGLTVYKADYNGHNRRKIADITGVNFYGVIDGMTKDDLLVVSCLSTIYLDDMGIIQEKDMQSGWITIINMNSGKVKTAPVKEAMQTSISNPFIDGNNIYYRAFISDEKWPSVPTGRAYCYNMETETEAHIGPSFDIYDKLSAFAGGYLVVSETEKITFISLSDNSERKIESPDKTHLRPISDYGSARGKVFFSEWQEGGNIFFQFDGGHISRINESRAPITVSCLLDNDVYVFGSDGEDYYYGVMDIADFEKGVYENIKVLMYPNRD